VDILLSPEGQGAFEARPILDDAGRLHIFWSAHGVGVEAFDLLYHSWAPVNDAMDIRNWQPPTLIAEGTSQCDVAMDLQGRLHLVYASASDGAGICHMLSEDNGDNWSSRMCIPHVSTVRDNEHAVKPRLAIDSRGYLHVVWVLADHSPLRQLAYPGRAVCYARSIDGGKSWSDGISVDEVDSRDESYEGNQPEWGNVVVDNQDRVHVVWVGSPDMLRYHQWSADGGVTWTPRQVAIPSGGYNIWCGIAVDGDGTLHLVWPSLQGLEYTRWDGRDWLSPVLFEGTEGAHHADLVVALGTELHAVWQNHGGDLGKVDRGRILHAMMRTGGESDEPHPLPTAHVPTQPAPTAEIEQVVESTVMSTARPTLTFVAPAAVVSNPITPLLPGVLVSFVLVGLVLLFRIRRI
jgi:hypothetical protein